MPWTAFINELAQQGETNANKNVGGGQITTVSNISGNCVLAPIIARQTLMRIIIVCHRPLYLFFINTCLKI